MVNLFILLLLWSLDSSLSKVMHVRLDCQSLNPGKGFRILHVCNMSGSHSSSSPVCTEGSFNWDRVTEA